MISRDGIIIISNDNHMELRRLIQMTQAVDAVVLRHDEISAAMEEIRMDEPTLMGLTHAIYPGSNVPLMAQPNRKARRAARR